MRKIFVRRLIVSALQIAITLGILIFLFHDSAKRAQMAEALRRADWHWLLAGVFAYGAVEILGAIQWQLLLRIQGFRLPWLQATSIFFIGVFFTLFTPGLIAGDAVQILYLVKEKPERKAGAVLVVVMDRILGAALARSAGCGGRRSALPLAAANSRDGKTF